MDSSKILGLKIGMIEGTFLGSPDGGIEPENQPLFIEEIFLNVSSNLPLY